MGLEAATYVGDLVSSNPTATDLRAQGDDHLRLIKATLLATFPNASRPFRFMEIDSAVAANITVTAPTDDNVVGVVNATAAARTVALPTSGLFDGFRYHVTKSDTTANTVTVSTAALINGASTYVLRNGYDFATFVYSASNSTWYGIGTPLVYVAPSSDTAGNYTISGTDHTKLVRINASATSRTVTLPSTVAAGFIAFIRKTDSTANTVTLDATSGGQINGANTVTLRYQYEELRVMFDGTTWTAPVYNGEEPGTAKLWFTDTAPTGWTMLEGQAISRTGNPRLFAVLSTSYGVGDGSTTFNLPDIRGRFLRVWDHAKGVDTAAASRTSPAAGISSGDHVGTEQDDANKDHRHAMVGSAAGNTPLTASNYIAYQANFFTDASYALYSHTNGTEPNLALTGSEGSEARGKNVAIAVVMKLG